MKITDELKHLFKIVRTTMGAPVRSIQLTDDMLCDLLEICVGNYAEKVQNWIIEQNWLNLYGKNSFLQNPQDLAFALTTRTMDFSRDFSYWFSREVGLQQRGPYELKKDFFKIERGKQCYLIPAGREINKVLYVTPSTTKAALYGNMGWDLGFTGGIGQFGNMGNGLGVTGFYIGSAYDTTLLASDIKYKNSLFRGDLSYKVTAGPEGTHIVHLLSVPGSPNTFGGLALDDASWGWNRYHGCVCWYTYYDTGNGGDEASLACALENKDDILLTPDQIPLSKMRYELMNEPTQQTIRQLLIAEAMITLGLIRGTFSGDVKIPDAELKMDYSIFLEQGKTEKEKVLNELKERLERMLPWNMMKNMNDMTTQTIEIMKQKPLGLYVI